VDAMSRLVEKQFQLVMLPFRPMEASWATYYQRAAACWEQVWLGLYEATKFPGPLFLDSLLRQDEAACIFTPTECVGMILFRTVDFRIMDFRKDSYFKEWNEEDLRKLLKHGSRVFVTSYLTVHPDFRNFSPQVKFKSVLLDLMIKRFLPSDADVISGVTRRDRNINDETYRLGAEVVCAERDYMEGRFKVDLIAIHKKNAVESLDPHVRALSDSIWNNRLDHLQTPPATLVAA